jgi:oligopeptide transport system substrate-binding protein
MGARVLTILAVVAILVAGLVGFGVFDRGATADDMDGGPVVLHRGNGAEPVTLDPHGSAGTWESNILRDLFLALYTDGADGTPVLGAAEAHEVSEDGLTHTLTIREGLVWSDGVPVTAHDFEFAFKRILDPNTAARYASLLYLIENAEEINTGVNPNLDDLGVAALGDRTLQLRLNRPAPFMPWLFTHVTMYPVPKHAVEEHGDNWTRPENIVTNGPFILADWVPNDHIRVVRNPRFYDTESVAIDEVVFYPTDDESAALRRFRAGELDMNSGFPSQQLAWLRENMPEETRIYEYIGTSYLAVNVQKAPLDNPNIRRALALAIDRDRIAFDILKKGQTPAYTLVPPQIPGYTPPEADFADWPMEDRIREAQRLMREAGYGPENPLEFVYRYRESVDNRRVAVAMGGFWRAIYVNVDLVNTEPAVHYQDLEQGNFEVGDAGWIADYPDAENYLFLLDSSSGLLNYGSYNNPEFDALLAEAQQTADLEERAAILARAEAITVQEMPLIPTTYSVSSNLVGLHVEGFEDNVVNIHPTRWMTIDESQRPEQPTFVDQIMRWFN